MYVRKISVNLYYGLSKLGNIVSGAYVSGKHKIIFQKHFYLPYTDKFRFQNMCFPAKPR